jgi:hypothetical protein
MKGGALFWTSQAAGHAGDAASSRVRMPMAAAIDPIRIFEEISLSCMYNDPCFRKTPFKQAPTAILRRGEFKFDLLSRPNPRLPLKPRREKHFSIRLRGESKYGAKRANSRWQAYPRGFGGLRRRDTPRSADEVECLFSVITVQICIQAWIAARGIDTQSWFFLTCPCQGQVPVLFIKVYFRRVDNFTGTGMVPWSHRWRCRVAGARICGHGSGGDGSCGF